MEEDHGKPGQEAEATAESYAPDLGISPAACVVDKPIDPCVIVIFGASGDLTGRKLIPSLYNLYLNQGLPVSFAIVGCSRTHWRRQDFQERMERSVRETGSLDTAPWKEFAERLYYQAVHYDDPASYQELGAVLDRIGEKHRTGGNRIFYLALPPSLYHKAGETLGQAGLSREDENGQGWVRIVIEKPFGRDLKTARDLNDSLLQSFQEHQIYRIDHYLAKETVQNMLVFRFANAIFEPIWNRSYIDHVKITAAETLGVEHRAGYYEQAGVLRDMFQNHMMQLLAITAMEPPSVFEADRVQDEKVKVFRCLKPFAVESIDEHLVLGQYGPGTIGGTAVRGYRDEPGVGPGSLIPTFALMRVFVDNWRWHGVPFYLMSGKRLPKKLTEMVIQFKEVPHSMFRHLLGEHITANRLILSVHPDEKITYTFQTKNPGATFCLRSVTMDFDYHQNYQGPRLDAYEKSLLDCMQGDHMLFWRQDGVELSWSFLTPILEECENCPERAERLRFYRSGIWGPLRAQEMENFFRFRSTGTV
jgi:glucose-6-phosphate 1-dehydrogenase